jgi:hypothetical protein
MSAIEASYAFRSCAGVSLRSLSAQRNKEDCIDLNCIASCEGHELAQQIAHIVNGLKVELSKLLGTSYAHI